MESSNSNKGLGFCSILTIIFVIAKLFGLIQWSWWLVFSPTLLSIGLGIFIMFIAFIIAVCDK